MTNSAPAIDDDVKPAATLLDMSVGSAVVLVLAIALVLVIAGIQGGSIRISSPLSPSVAGSALLFAMGPHLVVIALFTTGFPRTGDLAAIAVACWFGKWTVVMTMLSLDPRIATVVLLQAVMLIAALGDLWRRRNAPFVVIPRQTRLLGLFVPMIIGFAGYLMVKVPVTTELVRREKLSPQQRAGEMGYVLEPSPLLPDSVRLASDAWADYSVLGRLMGFAKCVETFRGDSGGPYPRSLRQLHVWSLSDTTSWGCASKLTWSTRDTSLVFLGPSDGRVIRYTPPAGPIDPYRPGPFTLETEAIWDSARSPGITRRPGVRNYLLDTAGKFHLTAKHRRVNMRDPVLPTCDPPTDFREVAECGVVYPARQRWGTLLMPFANFMLVNEVRVGAQFSPMIQFQPVIALDSVARVTIDWGDTNPPAVEEVPPVSERSYGSRHDWNRTVIHVYRTPGRRELLLTVTTRNGDVFTSRNHVDVKPDQ